MPVIVKREPHPEAPLERCCFCRAPTSFWVVNADVACCIECAKRATPDDVPTKPRWCRREWIADHSYRARERDL